MSFADGFTQGFGLVSNALDNKREAALREQDLGLRREMQQEDRIFRQEQIRHRNKVAADAAKWRADEAEKTAQYRLDMLEATRGSTDTQQAIDQTKAETARLGQELARDKFEYNKTISDRALAEEEKTRKLLKQGEAANNIYRLSMQLQNGELDIRDPDVVRQFNENYAVVRGTILDPSNAGDPAEFNAAKNFGVALENIAYGQEFNEDHIVSAMNMMISKATVPGTVIDESAIHAPEKYRDGTWKIVSREVKRIKSVGEEELVFSGDVEVTIEDDKGNQAAYIAPITDGRTTSGKQFQARGEDLIKGYGGYMEQLRATRISYPELLAARKQIHGDNWEAKSLQLELDARQKIRDWVNAHSLENVNSPYGMTWGQVLDHPKTMQAIGEQAAHFGKLPEAVNAVSVQGLIDMVEASREYADIKKQLGRELDRRETLELASLLDQDSRGRVSVPKNDQDAYIRFRKKLGDADKAHRVLNPDYTNYLGGAD